GLVELELAGDGAEAADRELRVHPIAHARPDVVGEVEEAGVGRGGIGDGRPKADVELPEQLDAAVGRTDQGDAYAGGEQEGGAGRLRLSAAGSALTRGEPREVEAEAEDDAPDLAAAEDAALDGAERPCRAGPDGAEREQRRGQMGLDDDPVVY